MKQYKCVINLKNLLEEKNLSQKDLSIKSGIRPNTISDIVRGARTVMNFNHIEKIASALDVQDINEIITLQITNKK